jgi:integrase
MKKAWIYQRPSGKYDVYYWAGKRRTWAGGLPTKKLATQALNLCIQKINSPVFGDIVNVDLKFARDEFMRKYRLEKAKATATKTEHALERFFDFAGEHRLDDYKHADFLEFAEHRRSEAVDSTVRYDLITARSFFRYCNKAGYLERVPEIPNIQPNTPTKGTTVPIAEFVRFCKAADADTRLSCIIGLVTGLRTMDVRRLTADNIEDEYIVTYAQKTGKASRHYIPPILQKMLSGFNGFEKISQRYFQDKINKYSKGWTFHDLRRTHGQLLRDADSGLIFAKESLGHSSTKTTEGFYATSRRILIDRIFTPILEQL